jgi:hypothetical protein
LTWPIRLRARNNPRQSCTGFVVRSFKARLAG